MSQPQRPQLKPGEKYAGSSQQQYDLEMEARAAERTEDPASAADLRSEARAVREDSGRGGEQPRFHHDPTVGALSALEAAVGFDGLGFERQLRTAHGGLGGPSPRMSDRTPGIEP